MPPDRIMQLRRRAVLAGLGVGEPQSWAVARDHLVEAAALGCGIASAQLAILDAPPAGGWLTAAPRQRLSTSPRISVARDLLSPAACAWLIQRAQGRVLPAQTFDSQSGAARSDSGRSNSAWELALDDLDLVVLMVRARIAATAGVPVGALEPVQVLHYAPGQSFARHFDFLDPDVPGYTAEIARNGQRIATVLTYLNADYQGGETDFPQVGIRFRGEPGDGLLFANVDPAGAPDRASLHAGLAPTSGEKWLLSQWVRDRAPI